MPRGNSQQDDRANTAQDAKGAVASDESGERRATRAAPSSVSPEQQGPLSGRRVLFIAEDQSWSEELRSQVVDAGAEAGCAGTVHELSKCLSEPEPWDAFCVFPQFGEQSALELIPRLLARVPRPGVVLYSLLGVPTKEAVELQGERVVFLTGRDTALGGLTGALSLAIKGAKELAAQRDLEPRPELSEREWLQLLGVRFAVEFGLSERERDVCVLYTSGLVEKEIACVLGVSKGTVASYLSRACNKLRCRDRAEIRSRLLAFAAARMRDEG